MNFRMLSVLGVIALAVAVWFYQEDIEVKPALPEVPTVDSEVTQIKAIQTDPKTGCNRIHTDRRFIDSKRQWSR